MKIYLGVTFQLILSVLFISCSSVPSKPGQEIVTFYVYPSGHFKAAQTGYKSVLKKFREIQSHLGAKGTRGRVGIGLVFPYLAWTSGEGEGPYKLRGSVLKDHDIFLRAAQELNIPVMVQFNGAVWHSPQHNSAFLNYWKTVGGGKYLSRYKDGKVNESIGGSFSKVSKKELGKYLNTSPYDIKSSQNALFLTLSPYATRLREARREALLLSVNFWKKLDLKYPNVIQSFSTDSEVSNFSFRFKKDRAIPIGYEEWNTKPFCEENNVKNCREFFTRDFEYKSDLEKKWFYFRASNHKAFVKDTVDIIRKVFSRRAIYTHQIPTPEGQYIRKYKKRDFASPLETAFTVGSFPGFTMYIHEQRDQEFKRLLDQIYDKSKSQWGMVEFNPGKSWKGTKEQLRQYTLDILNLSYEKGVRVICPLSWETNSLDFGIKDSGIDKGISDFLHQNI